MAEKRYENKEMQKRYEESRPKGGGKHKAEKDDGDDSERTIEDVVEEHGPADHVEIHSHHGDHVHKGTHHDVEAAKEHIGKAFGEHEGDEESEHDRGNEEHNNAGGATSGGIPTLG
jgi:hypothetical protein